MEKHIELVNGRVVVSTTWICANMEISRVTLGRWVAQGCPQLERGTFDLLDVLNWRGVLNTRDASAIGSGMDEPDDELPLVQQKMAAEVRLKRAQAELGELKNAVAAGKYVLRDELEAELTELFSGIRRAALALPRRVSGLLVGHVGRAEAAEIEQQCESVIRSALSRLSVGNLTPIRAARRKGGTPAGRTPAGGAHAGGTPAGETADSAAAD